MISCLSGKEIVKDDMLLTSFKNYVSSEEQQYIEEMFTEYDSNEEEVWLEVLSSYNFFKKVDAAALNSIIRELRHQEVIQKRRYVSNVFM